LNGLEYDSEYRVVAYWLFDQHPGQSRGSYPMPRGQTSRRVLADDVIHVFRKLRPGQTRGVTDFAPVMLPLRDLDDYDDAELMRKKVEACIAAFVTTPTNEPAAILGARSTDSKGIVEDFYPGMIARMRPGEAVTFADPKSSGGYADFQRFGLRKIASGVGVPYELMTGDLSQVNYSSYRAGLVDFRRRVEQDQWQIHVPVVCQRIWSRFQEEVARSTPGIGERTAVTWTPPRFELIDPLKETQAELEACLAGFDTWDEIVRRRGWTASEQLKRIADWQKKIDGLGVVMKSDYRTELAAKAAPPAAAPPRDDAEPEDEDEEAAA
jgi:lambda family phage portal protein